ncbi:MAG: M20 family metallopeptidase [Anaerovoracaceae bacterium]
MEYKIKKSLEELFAQQAHEVLQETIEIRRYLHMHPEIGFDTQNTEKLVREHLAAEGIEILPGKMGVFGLIRGMDSSHMVALRADMDALCLQEENDVPYRSQIPNKMHACGHDGHTAMLLGAAKLLQRNREELPMDVLLIFQPAEEGPNLGGARVMLADLQEKGIAEKIVNIFGLHVFNDYPTGTIGVRHGAGSSSTDEFYIKITGRGGHAGQPHKTVDALSVGAKIVGAMETFMARRIDPNDSAVFSVGIFEAGSAINIVAETAKISGTIRCQKEEVRSYILENMEQIVKGICNAYGAACHIDIVHGLPVLHNDEDATNYAQTVAESIVGADSIIPIEHTMLGAEDFAYFAQAIPACFLNLGSSNVEKGLTCLAHHPKFDFDESAMEYGIRLLCSLAAGISDKTA